MAGLGLFAAAVASSLAIYSLTRVIETAPGSNTVVLIAPLVGEYAMAKEVLVPGRSLQWKYNVAIPVKTDPFVSLVSSEEVATKDNKLAHLYARVKLRVTDPHALISSFGQNWFPDWAEPLMEETLAYYAGEHDEAFFKAMTGPPVSSLKLVEKMQAAFEDRSMPLEVIYAAPEYLPSSKDPRFVLSADSKKWVLSPRYSH